MPPSPFDMADVLFDRFPRHRVEILGGLVSVEPLPDGGHAEILTDVMAALFRAGLDEPGRAEVFRQLAIRLPTGPFDYAMPDVSVVEPESDDRMLDFNCYDCYDPACFRLVVEVGSSVLGDELTRKPAAYAAAGVPVYVVVDRAGEQVVVFTEPRGAEYRVREVRRPGEEFTLPPSIGASVTFAVADLVEVRR
ncbi:Endonuclease, Uma2 family (restriction endonuclease fold) [Streptomyces sp. TLI_053]|uniref:Uma2 family endonuclease n=1 Tax=Streptomyces sp. TLI_053 TaxID=1855352 RepID=UPI00087AA34D|nr:Uma2 family endonuclease [Streptomyces sp. TLI_053]SDT79677.1 Endonuclease, Uma2 family (restriction endonuclease fold) [Streptomyces sp. TLI_053]